jgi:hypothetical protein
MFTTHPSDSQRIWSRSRRYHIGDCMSQPQRSGECQMAEPVDVESVARRRTAGAGRQCQHIEVTERVSRSPQSQNQITCSVSFAQ